MLKMAQLFQNLNIEESEAWEKHSNCKAERRRVLKSISTTRSKLLEEMEKLSIKIMNEPEPDFMKQKYGIQLMEAFVEMESEFLNLMTLDEKSMFRQIKHCFTFDTDGSLMIDQGKEISVSIEPILVIYCIVRVQNCELTIGENKIFLMTKLRLLSK